MNAMRLAVGVLLCSAVSIAAGSWHPWGDVHTIPPSDRSTLLQGAGLPAQARAVLLTKCADCHSETTAWPAYARFAPGSWLIERDVAEGRRHLDLSQWQRLSAERQEVLKQEIAQLTKDEVEALTSLLPADEGGSGTSDAVRGKALFERRCTGCHALDSNREGPRLRGVFGRQAGSAAGFTYSSALRERHVAWNSIDLERWLRDPEELVPGNNMDFSVPKSQERADIVAFLASLK
jgi:cytochrome c